MTDYVKDKVLAVQEFVLLSGRALKSLLRPPRYAADVLIQMDTIGVGSLVIVLLTGFFSGAVLALQSYAALVKFGATILDAPADYPQYNQGKGYYAVFFADPDGLKLEYVWTP